MGFFKDLRDDISQAVNELLPDEEFFNVDGLKAEKEAAEETEPVDMQLASLDTYFKQEDSSIQETLEAEDPVETVEPAEEIGIEDLHAIINGFDTDEEVLTSDLTQDEEAGDIIAALHEMQSGTRPEDATDGLDAEPMDLSLLDVGAQAENLMALDHDLEETVETNQNLDELLASLPEEEQETVSFASEEEIADVIMPLEESIEETEAELPVEEANEEVEVMLPLEETIEETEAELPVEEANEEVEVMLPLEETIEETEAELPVEEVNEEVELPVEEASEEAEADTIALADLVDTVEENLSAISEDIDLQNVDVDTDASVDSAFDISFTAEENIEIASGILPDETVSEAGMDLEEMADTKEEIPVEIEATEEEIPLPMEDIAEEVSVQMDAIAEEVSVPMEDTEEEVPLPMEVEEDSKVSFPENEVSNMIEKEDKIMENNLENAVAKDEVTVITKGTIINGSIITDGALEVNGTITGDVECLGTLTINGNVSGHLKGANVVVSTPKLDGGIDSQGDVKINVGTIVIGDVSAKSATISGAVKGEIDVQGPVVVDSTAIVKGNINAKSVQINNGAVVDGYCKLTYAEVDIDNFFDEE
ncbi:MAG: polymer-forming cytoskeletal protein [Lachnospiraceae bacterium]|nr:polymer-forming cytoskeletal protein [Lachnospiraceae bacterium]